MMSIAVRRLSISRPLVVAVVGIAVSVSMVSITVGGIAITMVSITIRSLSISRPLVVSVVGIRIGMISMVGITIGRVAIAIRKSMMASISFSFRLSCDSCEQAEGNNSDGFHFYWLL